MKMGDHSDYLIEQMLLDLDLSRNSMRAQTNSMSVLDKSNNILLHIEDSKTVKQIPIKNNSCSVYTYSKETVNDLTKIVDKFDHFINQDGTPLPKTTEPSTSFEDYLETATQRAEYLGSNVRKLLAAWDRVQQMRAMLHRQEMESDDNKENIYL